jgi:hypothetical protein
MPTTYHSNYDRMPVTHARLITGRVEGGGKALTAEEWVRFGGWAEDFPQLVREANAILDSITPQQEALLKRAVHDLSIDMNELQCQIRDQALDS